MTASFRVLLARLPLSLLAGMGLTTFLVLGALLAPLISPADPLSQDLYATFQPMSWHHPFGTDAFGRDVFSRIVYGTRYSLAEVCISVLVSCIAGTLAGMLAALVGGYVEQAVMWVVDIIFAFPGIVLALLILSLLGPGFLNMLLAISLFSIPVYARLAQNLTHSLQRTEYVEAARTLGAGTWRILHVHIMRNALGPILVQSTLTAGSVILTASSLSFLGLGVAPATPEWGAMMSDGRNYLGIDILPSLFPGLAITIAVLGFNLLGEGVRKVMGK
ncbi:ABC transporter permease [Gluconacetobacter entanii]|uniref:ABC transporter permease n=1 Tax=Gluconacetobacter entanii TaxID=108528 RepID=UPI00187B2B1C|nr:ABC transporter permease [Gluconacetobacter entanii]MBE7619516.1 ABC transporter permease subunit [Komagataeibacter sp. FXV2]MBY4638858.1 ABC transporter permease [Gluconacetobacter entanii]MCW4580835.1 ABC transporter permease [Gluconacetobacter entanii]MCW4584164.1 ABC transporter permease [Gluconacetobacter entanii]MCW4587508.1 ABC transporter permease [Gluconacetobacter entanii]